MNEDTKESRRDGFYVRRFRLFGHGMVIEEKFEKREVVSFEFAVIMFEFQILDLSSTYFLLPYKSLSNSLEK